LAASSPQDAAEYFVFDQKTGSKLVVKPEALVPKLEKRDLQRVWHVPGLAKLREVAEGGIGSHPSTGGKSNLSVTARTN
jgi:hypothetical protein